MTLTVKVKLLNLTIIHYNLVINGWIVFDLDKTTLLMNTIDHHGGNMYFKGSPPDGKDSGIPQEVTGRLGTSRQFNPVTV